MNARLRAWDLIVALLFHESNDGAANETVRAEEAGTLERMLDSAAISWPTFVTLANVHEVTATVWQALLERGLGDAVPADARDYLSSFHALNRDRNESLERQLDECIGALAAGGIRSMPLKGAMYRRVDRPAFEHRFATDIDLLVPPDAGDAAWDAMLALGYEPSPTGHLRPPGHHHLVPLVRESTPAAVELHLAAVPRYAAAALPVEDVWRDAAPAEGAPPACALPALTDAAMLAFLHAEIVDRSLVRFHVPLRTLHDLDRLGRLGHVDWRRNLDRAARIGARHRLRAFLHVLDRVRGARPERGYRLRGSARYAVARAALGWRGIAVCIATLDKFAARSLRAQYGIEGGPLTLTAYRARRGVEMARNGLRRLRNRRDGPGGPAA